MWEGLTLFVLWLSFVACQEQLSKSGDLTYIPYQPEQIVLQTPKDFIPMPIPEDNPLTREGVYLGRLLFYDPILSADSSLSCAFCHQPQLAFTDARALSLGMKGKQGKRSSPSLLNVGYYYKGLFWDGRSPSLEEQALHPLRDSLEMASNLSEIARRLQQDAEYPVLFRKAFGIRFAAEIDSVLIGKALAQFQRSLISGDAKFDRVRRAEAAFTPAEERGRNIFFDAVKDLPDAECAHCHGDPLFTSLDFFNNGIMTEEEQAVSEDLGRYSITSRPSDRFKFRTPTLRNAAVTAPYMHDGRFASLEEVIDHYVSGGHYAENVNPNVRKLNFDPQDKADLIAFLHTLTDTTALQNPDYGNPF